MAVEPAVHIISGKGGTGKTVIATALALALADSGQRVLLVETEGRVALAPLLAVSHIGYDEERIVGHWSGTLHAQSIEPAPALVDYVRSFFPLPGAATVLQRTGATTFVTALAPGLKDVLITGKFCEAARRTRGSNYAFDAVVVDAPPTGRVHRFLNVTSAVSMVAPVGNVKAHAERIATVIKSPRTRIHFVVNDEEAAIDETIEAIGLVNKIGVHVGAVIRNRVEELWPALPPVAAIEDALRAAGASPVSGSLAKALVTSAHIDRAEAKTAHGNVTRLSALGQPVAVVPNVVASTVADLPRRLARVLELSALQATT